MRASCSHDGDIVSIDCGAIVDGWHGDAAFTAPVGEAAPPRPWRLIDVGRPGARRGHRRDGRRRPARRHRRTPCRASSRPPGFAVVRDYTGHGIGRAMHEDPAVHNTGKAGTGTRLRSGNVLAIEPMVSAGTDETVVLDDGWSVRHRRRRLGRPHRAHRRRHRRRPGDPDSLRPAVDVCSECRGSDHGVRLASHAMAGVMFDGVTKRYGDVMAVDDLDLDIEDGEFMVLLGPSGCGKTTALRMIAGPRGDHRRASCGSATGSSTTSIPRDRDIAMVFQSYALYPHMTVREEHRVAARHEGHRRSTAPTSTAS